MAHSITAATYFLLFNRYDLAVREDLRTEGMLHYLPNDTFISTSFQIDFLGFYENRI